MTTILIDKIFLVSLILLLVSCSDQIKGQEVEKEDQIELINYLALGDSYTIGQGVEPAERWPNQLVTRIVQNGYELDKFRIIAQTGWTTGNLINAVDAAELEGYNLVSLLIGVNNQFQNLDFAIFTTQFDLLLDRAIQIVGNKERVFVVSIPDYGVTPFGSSNAMQIAEEIDEYNAYISNRCSTQGITFINITEISRNLGDSPGALAPDNLHPSSDQYTAWVDVILPEVLELFKQ